MKKFIHLILLDILIILLVVNFKGYVKYISFIFMYLFCLILSKKRINIKKLTILSFVFLFFIINVEIKWNMLEKDIHIDNNSVIIGRLIKLNKQTEYKNVYKFKLKYINKEKVNYYILLYLDKEVIVNSNDIIYCNMEFEKPLEATNKGGFNNKLYLYSNNIKGYGYISKIYKIENNPQRLSFLINNYKIEIINNVLSKTDRNTAGVILSIMFGDKRYLSEKIKDSFSNSNMSHILNISGTQIVYLTHLYIGFFSLFKIKKKKYSFLFFIILTVYILFVNASIAIIKSYIIYLITLIYKLIKKQENNMIILLTTILLLLIYNPLIVFNISFVLSFCSVIGIRLFSKKIIYKLEYNINEKRTKITSRINNILGISLSVYISIFPFITKYFNKIYVTGIFSNIFSMPAYIITTIFSIIYLITFKIVFISELILILISFFSKVLILISKIFSMFPLANILIFPMKWLEILIYYLVIYFIFISPKYYYILKSKAINILKKIDKKNKIIILICLILICIILIQWYNNLLCINFINVGQGDCTLIRNKGYNILIDGGGSDNFDIGEKTLLPYLLNKRICVIDYIIISHFDSDHVKGLYSIVENLKVKNIVISKQYEESINFNTIISIAKMKKINIIVVEKGDVLKINKNLRIDILWPCKKMITENPLNNNSIVCKIIYKEFSMLFTGDIEEISEKSLIYEYTNTNSLQSIILKVAHHGSNSSSTEDFLNEVNPKIVLIGVGSKNTYGHPSEKIIERFKKLRLFNL